MRPPTAISSHGCEQLLRALKPEADRETMLRQVVNRVNGDSEVSPASASESCIAATATRPDGLVDR
jgi:molybdopterin biosynthesis enzyme